MLRHKLARCFSSKHKQSKVDIMKIVILILIILFIVFLGACNINQESRVNENVQLIMDSSLTYNLSVAEMVMISHLSHDSAIGFTSKLINKYPQSADLIKSRAAAYLELKEYEKCRDDLEKLILLEPDFKHVYMGMLDDIECKIKTGGDCGGSLKENVVTVTIDYDLADTNETKKAQAMIKLIKK